MVKRSKLDFDGQHIYIGLDIHRKSWGVSVFTEHLEHKTFVQPPDVGLLVRYLQRTFPGGSYHCVYEAGYCGFWVYDELRERGIDCVVVNPADVPTKDKEKQTKTDKVDCRKLARSLRSGEIEGIYVPSRRMTEDRGLIRTRRSMVSKQTRCKNQIKSILGFYGIRIPEEFSGSCWSKSFISWIEAVQMEMASGNILLKAHLEELCHLRQIIADLNKEIRALARTDKYRRMVVLLKTIPGISTLSAMTLLTELYDVNRFKSLDHLASYIGLIPRTKSSGEMDLRTNMTTRRNPILRYVLIESAWVAARKDPALMLAFNDLSKRMSKTKAIVRIARKLLNRIRYVLKNQEEYVPCVVD
jgi:transposase